MEGFSRMGIQGLLESGEIKISLDKKTESDPVQRYVALVLIWKHHASTFEKETWKST